MLLCCDDMWGRSPRGNNGACSALCQISVTSSANHKQSGPFWCWLPDGWFVYVLEPCGSLQGTLLWGWEFVSLPPLTPQVFSISGLRLYFPAVEPWVTLPRALLGSSCSPWFICTPVWDFLLHQALPCWVRQLLPCPLRSTILLLAGSACCRLACPSPLATASLGVLPTQLPIFTPSTILDECVFFNSLVVRLSYSSIFCQFWLFFVFKLLSSFWLCEETQCVYLYLHLGQKSLE